MDNREKILNCALELFHARGYDAVGVQEIAETAGVTKPTLYYYFGNKRGLLEALLSREYAQFRSEVFDGRDEKEQIWLTLPKIASAYVDYGMNHRKSYMPGAGRLSGATGDEGSAGETVYARNFQLMGHQ